LLQKLASNIFTVSNLTNPRRGFRLITAYRAKKRFDAARRDGRFDDAIDYGWELLDLGLGPRPGLASTLAMLAERINDHDKMRAALRRAFLEAGNAEDSKAYLSKNWSSLSAFWLNKCFDPASAHRVAKKAASLGADGAWGVTEQYEEAWRLERDFYGDLSVAGEALRMFAGNGRYLADDDDDERRCAVLLPSSMFSRMHPAFRPNQRRVASWILQSMRQLGQSYTPLPRLGAHGTPGISKSHRYIAYHTIDDSKNGLHWKELDQPYLFRFDSRGYSGWSELASLKWSDLPLGAIDPHAARAYIESYRRETALRNSSKYEQRSLDEGEQLPPRYVFVALQLLDDTVQHLGNLSCLEMLAEVAATCRRRRIALVVKRHPMCKSREVRLFLENGTAAGDFSTSRASIHRLLRDAIAVCTVNSSVGAEALAYRKPIYVFGKADYQHACFRISEPGEFSARFVEDKLPLSEDDFDRFNYFYRTHKVVDTRSDGAFDMVKSCVASHLAQG
jgi:hypothetical protein